MYVTNIDLPPPRCLTAVRVSKPDSDLHDRSVKTFISDEMDSEALAKHQSSELPEPWVSTRDELKVWSFGCPCGAERGRLYGVRTDDLFCAPVRFECTKCGVSATIFDPAADGWKAETAKRKKKARKEPKTTYAMHCRKCKNTLWRPVMMLTYQGDAEHFSSIPPDQLQNYFDVMRLGGACVSCGEVAFGFDAECA